MTSRLRSGLALLLALGTISMAQLAAPTIVSACSCRAIDNPDLAKAAANPDTVVFIGVITSISPPGMGSHLFGDMLIQRIYKGELPAVARVRGGGGGDCTMPLEVGLRMLWVSRYTDNQLNPSLCGLHRDPMTPEGKALVDQAEAVFGPGRIPGAPPAADATATPANSNLATFAVGLVAALVVFVTVALIAASRRQSAGHPT